MTTPEPKYDKIVADSATYHTLTPSEVRSQILHPATGLPEASVERVDKLLTEKDLDAS